jgi:hypothetical protein
MKKNSNIWPNLIIPGAGRAGKMALCHYLDQLDDVFIPDPTEPNFFSYISKKKDYTSPDRRFYENIITNIDSYHQIYENSESDTYRVDASGSYLVNANLTVEQIHNLIPKSNNIKIIILLRNPVIRTFSAYSHYVMNGFEMMTPKIAFSNETIQNRLKKKWSPNYDYISGSIYAENVSVYLRNFDNVKIILTENLWNNTDDSFNEICSFLGLSIPYRINLSTKINTSGKTKNKFIYDILNRDDNLIRRFTTTILKHLINATTRKKIKILLRNKNLHRPSMDNEIYEYLIEYFKDDIKKLELVINKDLSHWLIPPKDITE